MGPCRGGRWLPQDLVLCWGPRAQVLWRREKTSLSPVLGVMLAWQPYAGLPEIAAIFKELGLLNKLRTRLLFHTDIRVKKDECLLLAWGCDAVQETPCPARWLPYCLTAFVAESL